MISLRELAEDFSSARPVSKAHPSHSVRGSKRPADHQDREPDPGEQQSEADDDPKQRERLGHVRRAGRRGAGATLAERSLAYASHIDVEDARWLVQQERVYTDWDIDQLAASLSEVLLEDED
jgi:hypothetical protein